MKVSVVIPAYNSAAFIAEAVHSAFRQRQTAEVIVVDDGSTDETLNVCGKLKSKYVHLILLRHPDHKNHGVGPTRNLGIRQAASEYIAFLDADDFYLDNRFETTERIFQEHPDADGVYECLGIHFQNDTAKERWFQRFDFELTTLKEIVAPEDLIYKMAPLGKSGWFSGDALTVKRSIFRKCGNYSDLRLSQDTELFMKMAITASLYPGNITEPVACRRVHEGNRVTTEKINFFKNRILLWQRMMQWVIDRRLARRWMWIFSNQLLKAALISAKLEKNPVIKIASVLLAFINYIFSRHWIYLLFRI